MEVNLKKESWHFRLNRWSLRKDPHHWSLCPYFWLTVWHMITFLPSLPFRAVEGLGDRLVSGTKIEGPINRTFDRIMMADEPKWMQRLGKWFDRSTTVGIKIWLGFIGSLVLLSFGSVIWTEGWIGLLKILMLIGGMLIGLVLVAFLTIGMGTITESDAWKMCKGMWRSFIDKACPGINWE